MGFFIYSFPALYVNIQPPPQKKKTLQPTRLVAARTFGGATLAASMGRQILGFERWWAPGRIKFRRRAIVETLIIDIEYL